MRAHAGAFQRSPRAYQHVLHKQWAKRLLNKRGYCSARQNSTPTCLLDKWQQSTFFLLYFCLLIVLSLSFQLAHPVPLNPNLGRATVSPARPTVAPALEEPISVPARWVSTAPTLILLTPLAPVSQKNKTKQKTRAAQTLVEVCWQFFFFFFLLLLLFVT